MNGTEFAHGDRQLTRASLGPENRFKKTLIMIFWLFFQSLWIRIKVRIIQEFILKHYRSFLVRIFFSSALSLMKSRVSIFTNLVDFPQLAMNVIELLWPTVPHHAIRLNLMEVLIPIFVATFTSIFALSTHQIDPDAHFRPLYELWYHDRLADRKVSFWVVLYTTNIWTN